MPHHPAHTQRPGGGPAVAVTRIPVAPEQVVVFFGDGITAEEPGYIEVIRQALDHTRGDLHLQLVNAGAPGDTIRDLEARLERDVLAAQPAWVVVCIGANDYYKPALAGPAVPLPEFEARYRALLGHIRAAGATPILLTIPVVGLESEERTIPDPQPYNAAIRALAAAESLPLVDVYQAFHAVYTRAADYKQTVHLSTDGLHPNSQGYALIARSILVQLGLLQK
jgi:acyl-CoA thioesterase-1